MSLLDELDWEAFALRTKHEDGYAVYKCLVEGTNFHQDNQDRAKRLAVAKKAAREKESEGAKRKLSGYKPPGRLSPNLRPPNFAPRSQYNTNPRSFDQSSASYNPAPPGKGRTPRRFNCDQYGHHARDCTQLPKPPRG